jgi:hypothetical protein
MTLDPSIDPKAFVLSENDVVAILNVPKDLVREKRGPQGERWAYGPRRSVLWCLLGMEALRSEIAAGRPQSEGASGLPERLNAMSKHLLAPPMENAPALPDGVQILEVMGCRFPNRTVMHCIDPNSDPLLGGLYRAPKVVHVRDAGRFVPGMRILARRREGRQSNIFEFAGNPAAPEAGARLPRQVGQW